MSQIRRFLYGGYERLIQSDGYEDAARKIRVSIWLLYAGELDRAGFLRRMLIEIRMYREIRRALRRLASPWAMYSVMGFAGQ
jgi:hypothetical protein